MDIITQLSLLRVLSDKPFLSYPFSLIQVAQNGRISLNIKMGNIPIV